MARSIKEIKNDMGEQYINNPNIRELYGISGNVTFEKVFSSVSVESILFYIFATVAYTIEVLFDQLKIDVDQKIAQGTIATIPWYHKIAMDFQYGDELVFDDITQSYMYEIVDSSKRIIKYAAVRDLGNGVEILVSKEKDGTPQILTTTELTAFKEYINKIKIAGVYTSIKSQEADLIKIEVKVCVDPMIIDPSTGMDISNSVKSVENAVNDYLKNIVYGGTFNKTKLVDAVQKVSGVVDVMLISVLAKKANDEEYISVTGNNYTSDSGCFKVVDLSNTISYVLQF